jgi:ureidoglycolate hydrolase
MGDAAPRTGTGPAPGGPAGRRVTAAPLTAEAWTPFGWLPVDDTDPADGTHRLAFQWEDPHVNVIGHGVAEIVRAGGVLHCPEMYRHDTHTQVLMVLDVPAVVAVAPADVTFEDAGDAGRIRAFLLEPLDAFVLARGTWHWGPFPAQAGAVRLFNVQGLRYAEDNTRVDLEALGAAVDVVLPSATA